MSIVASLLEMFLWEKAPGLRAFHNTPAQAAATKILAANQGLYNGFLAAGLVWGRFIMHDTAITMFFLICVIVAAIYGSASLKTTRILFVQGLPAALAAGALLLAH